MNKSPLLSCLLLASLSFVRVAHADPPAATVVDAQGLLSMSHGGAIVDDPAAPGGKALEVQTPPFRLEVYSYNKLLTPPLQAGWYRVTVRVRSDVQPAATDSIDFAVWNQIGKPGAFRYQTRFLPQELPPSGQYGELSRMVHVGELIPKGSYGIGFGGAWKGLRLASVTFQPLDMKLQLQGARTDKILYGAKDSGHVDVSILNSTTAAQSAHLTVKIAGGLAQVATLYDSDVSVAVPATPGEAQTVEVPLPPQSEYGHGISVTLSQDGKTVGSADNYFYVSDHPMRIGQLGGMQVGGEAYAAESAPGFVEQMRSHYFPMYEIDFWAPDDAIQLVPDKDRWWAGQTLARLSVESIKDRIDLGHAQGMKVLGYANLRYDYSFRIAEFFRKHPELCDWDANNTDMSYAVSDIARQAREDDAERFDPANPKKPKFAPGGIWGLMTGNPAMVDFHLDQITKSTREFDWDGFRYDDRYDYDYRAVDLLGRQMPFPGVTNPTILAHIRETYEKAKPGLIYGHNMEWTQKGNIAWAPMPLDAQPYDGDDYTEFVRDDGLHLQERWTAHIVDRHLAWKDVAEYLFRDGVNARRFGGQAYNISGISSARPTDSRYLTAFNLAGTSHIAYDVRDDDIGYMRLACRFSELFYGDRLTPVLEPEKMLKVDAGGKEIWWQRYVRCCEIEPGHRLYIAHLINPPRGTNVNQGDPNPPDPVSNINLDWTLPAGWKATAAWHLAGEGGGTTESSIQNMKSTICATTTDVVGRDIVQQTLPLQAQGNSARVTLPSLQIWSMVVLDCTGPAADVAPPLVSKLPPIPAQPQLQEPPAAQNPGSPNGDRPWVINAETKWRSGTDSKQEAAVVADPDTATGSAVQAPVSLEAYAAHWGQGGTYRISVRVKSVKTPPAGAQLSFMAWPSGRKWTLNQNIPLANLTPSQGWQTISRETRMDYGNDNIGVSLKGGFDGLLIDNLTIEQLSRDSDSKQMAERGVTGWAKDQALVPHQGLKVWYGEGLYYEAFHLVEALHQIPGVQVDEGSHYTWREKRGFNGAQWGKPEELAAYDLVILSNIDLKTFSLQQRDWLRGYVQAGGALLLTGGPYGFGRGFWHESDLIEPIFPVQMHAYDLRPDGIGAPLQLAAAPGGFLRPFAPGPTTLWLHEVSAKSGATVQLKAGNNPALVTWQTGNGRVAVVTLAPLGEENASVWWKWDGWTNVMAQTVQWLLKK